jgi:hypothetical protein
MKLDQKIKRQKQTEKDNKELVQYLTDNNRTLKAEYDLIQQNKSELSLRLQNYLVNTFFF